MDYPKNNGHAYSDETIRQFLLGALSATELAHFEQSLFTDDELSERVRLAELELSDEYAAGRLSGSEQNLFETGFLLTADRQRELNVSRALQQTLTLPSPARVPASLGAQILSVFDLRTHAWKYAFAALILMLVLGTALLVRKQRLQITQRHDPTPVTPKPSATAIPDRANHPHNSSAPSHREEPPALPLHEDSAPGVVLNSNTPLQAAPVIRTSGDTVTIELRLDQPLADAYDVNIMTTDGESLFIENAIKRTQADTLAFDVPASAIESGDFQIALMRADGEPKQRAGVYYFRVR
jgi:post-segregation antitoxin (ccd killing protein)